MKSTVVLLIAKPLSKEFLWPGQDIHSLSTCCKIIAKLAEFEKDETAWDESDPNNEDEDNVWGHDHEEDGDRVL